MIGAAFSYFYSVKGMGRGKGKTDKKQYPDFNVEEVKTVEECDSAPSSFVESTTSSSTSLPIAKSSGMLSKSLSNNLSMSSHSIIIGSQDLNSNFTVQL